METSVIKTPRLILRYFTSDDLDNLTPILADPEVMRYSISGVKTLHDLIFRYYLWFKRRQKRKNLNSQYRSSLHCLSMPDQ